MYIINSDIEMPDNTGDDGEVIRLDNQIRQYKTQGIDYLHIFENEQCKKYKVIPIS